MASLVLFTKNNKLWNERKKDFFVYMAVSTYNAILKDVENQVRNYNFSEQGNFCEIRAFRKIFCQKVRKKGPIVKNFGSFFS